MHYFLTNTYNIYIKSIANNCLKLRNEIGSLNHKSVIQLRVGLG